MILYMLKILGIFFSVCYVSYYYFSCHKIVFVKFMCIVMLLQYIIKQCIDVYNYYSLSINT